MTKRSSSAQASVFLNTFPSDAPEDSIVHLCNWYFFLFKLDMLKQNNLKNEEELTKSKELLNLENKKVEELKKEL